jgi:hypothetical protein
MEYFDKYQKAPGREIEPIFYQKAKNGLSNDLKEEIEEDILPALSEEYENEGVNVDYLVDETIKYFTEKHLIRHGEEISALAKDGQLIEAQKLAGDFKPIAKDSGNWIDFSNPEIKTKIKKAFTRIVEPLIKFPGAMGEFLNNQLRRGAFVAFMAIEKAGKTFLLLEFAMRARKQGRRVAFFQAGDMTEDEQIIRTSIYLNQKSNLEMYCGRMYQPVKDCIWNQMDRCDNDERSSNFGVFDGKTDKWIRREVTKQDLIEAFKENEDYKPCTNCDHWKKSMSGATWLKEIDIKKPLTYQEAQNSFDKFFIKNQRNFKLSSHPNNTLTVKQAEAIMDIWEKEDGFIPDVIIFDYADIMADDTVKEFRHKQNKIWMDLRGLSQKRKALVITVTQVDSDSYTKDILSMDNFSEDKRKYAHVTAMFGLNRDHKGREKEIGIMRLNEIVVREGEFNNNHQVHVLQNLKRGRPFLGSYW